MHTKLLYPLTLAITLTSVVACDPDVDSDNYADLESPDAQAPAAIIEALTAPCDPSDEDCALALDMIEELSQAEDWPDTETKVVLLGDSCVGPTLVPCSALSLFDSASETSHLLSLDDHPSAINYTNNPPDNGDKVWIMGDWDGDGVDSPGYYAKGRFRYTDVPFWPSNSWSQALDLHPWNNNTDPTLPLVAGRFLAGYDNDCVGVIHGDGVDIQNPTFHLEYWCELAPGFADESHGTQWIGAVLPDSNFPTGEHEFAAGDWDGDGIDELAVRKDLFITYTLADPELDLAPFAQAQRWGVPPDELTATGVFVAGDWNGDGIDGWGVLYDDNHFYHRNDLTWNPGPLAYHLQHIDNLFTDRSVSSHQFGL